MASDELDQRVKDVYRNLHRLFALWQLETKADEKMTAEVERLQKLTIGGLDGLIFLMGLEVPDDGT